MVRQESGVDEHQWKPQLFIAPMPTKKLFEACMRFFRESHSDENVNRE
jgi:hypothetical protein